MPQITLGESQFSGAFLDVEIPSQKITRNPLNIEFIVDRDLDNYTSILEWIEYYEHTLHVTDSYKQGTLSIMHPDSTLIKEFIFDGLFPNTLSPLVFNSDSHDDNLIRCNATFNYTKYYLKKSC